MQNDGGLPMKGPVPSWLVSRDAGLKAFCQFPKQFLWCRLKTFSTDSSCPEFQINTKYLAPLFLEYDDKLRDKDNAIRHLEVRFHTHYTQNECVFCGSHESVEHQINSSDWENLFGRPAERGTTLSHPCRRPCRRYPNAKSPRVN